MIVRYDTVTEGIEQICSNDCVATQDIKDKFKEEWLNKQDKWVIRVVFILNEDPKNPEYWYLQKDNTLKGGNAWGFNVKTFPTKQEGEEFINRYNFDKLNEKIQKELKEEKDINSKIKIEVVPWGEYSIQKVGSYHCQHCPYCFGRSSNLAGWEMVGFGDKIKMREVQWIKCSAVYKKLSWKIKVRRYFYQLWVNKLEQPLINFAKKCHIKPLYNKLNYGWWF